MLKQTKGLMGRGATMLPPAATEEEARLIPPDAPVLGVLTAGGAARAYPLALLMAHAVNDEIGEEPVLVTFCERCDSGMAFDPRVGSERLVFSVYGREVYDKDMGMYRLVFMDESETLWTQEGSAVKGQRKGATLRPLASERTTWQQWQVRNPATTVLFQDTRRGSRPSLAEHFFLRERNRNPGLDLEALCLGVREGSLVVAYPFNLLRASGGLLKDSRSGDISIAVLFQEQLNVARAFIVDAPDQLELVDERPARIRHKTLLRVWDLSGLAVDGGTDLRPAANQQVSRLFAWLMYHPESSVYIQQTATDAPVK